MVRGGEVDAAVEGDRVVDASSTSGRPGALDVEHAVAERLVVVDDVEVAGALAQQPGRAQAEGPRLGEAGRSTSSATSCDVDRGRGTRAGRGVRNGSGSR